MSLVDSSSAAVRPSAADRRRVLVVEDDDVVRQLIVRILSRGQMEVVEEARSDTAIAVLQEDEIAAVVLDLMILPSGGKMVLQWMERNRPDLVPRTVVVSAASPNQIEEAIQGRNCFCLPKPFEVAELASLVESCAGPGPRLESDRPQRR